MDKGRVDGQGSGGGVTALLILRVAPSAFVPIDNSRPRQVSSTLCGCKVPRPSSGGGVGGGRAEGPEIWGEGGRSTQREPGWASQGKMASSQASLRSPPIHPTPAFTETSLGGMHHL